MSDLIHSNELRGLTNELKDMKIATVKIACLCFFSSFLSDEVMNWFGIYINAFWSDNLLHSVTSLSR
jgi:hypothetical protein